MAHPLRRKIEVVSAVLGGSAIPEVARSTGIPEGLIAKWHDVALSSLSIGLGFTGDEGELPSLVAIMQKVDVWRFPLALLNGATTGICFFPGYHHGRLSVALLQAAGLASIAIVDPGPELLQQMMLIYPNCDEAVVGDPIEAARMLTKSDRNFDIVVCDPLSGNTSAMAGEHFLLFRGLARKCYIFALTIAAMSELGARPVEAEVEARLSDLHRIPIRVLSLVVRNRAICWVAVRAC